MMIALRWVVVRGGRTSERQGPDLGGDRGLGDRTEPGAMSGGPPSRELTRTTTATSARTTARGATTGAAGRGPRRSRGHRLPVVQFRVVAGEVVPVPAEHQVRLDVDESADDDMRGTLIPRGARSSRPATRIRTSSSGGSASFSVDDECLDGQVERRRMTAGVHDGCRRPPGRRGGHACDRDRDRRRCRCGQELRLLKVSVPATVAHRRSPGRRDRAAPASPCRRPRAARRRS